VVAVAKGAVAKGAVDSTRETGILIWNEVVGQEPAISIPVLANAPLTIFHRLAALGVSRVKVDSTPETGTLE
jgi:hypothetical protein